MTSLGSHVFFWKIFLKNFSKFKMAAIFRSKMTENGVLRFCFHPLQTNVSWNFLITAEINEKLIKLNKRKCILAPGASMTTQFGKLSVRTNLRGSNQRAIQSLDTLHPAYDPLSYVILFPNGSQGYHKGLDCSQIDKDNNTTSDKTQKQILTLPIRTRMGPGGGAGFTLSASSPHLFR